MVIDISKITLENYLTYNECIKYEIPKQRKERNLIPRKKYKTAEERKQKLKEYQHQYYLNVTKVKRKNKKIIGG